MYWPRVTIIESCLSVLCFSLTLFLWITTYIKRVFKWGKPPTNVSYHLLSVTVLLNILSPQVTEFVNLLDGRESFFGFREETIPSLVLSFLPGTVETHESMHLGISSLEESCSSAGAFLLNGVLRIIQHSGFLPLPVPVSNVLK